MCAGDVCAFVTGEEDADFFLVWESERGGQSSLPSLQDTGPCKAGEPVVPFAFSDLVLSCLSDFMFIFFFHFPVCVCW